MGFSSNIPWLFAQIEDHGLGRTLNQELQPAFQEQVLRATHAPPKKYQSPVGEFLPELENIEWVDVKTHPAIQTWGLISD